MNLQSPLVEVAQLDIAVAHPASILRESALDQPARWLSALSPKQQSNVRWVATSSLKLHPDCDFLPFLPRSYAAIRASVIAKGILFPLGVGRDGRVLDGRYRLRAAIEAGLESVPVLVIDVAGNEAVQWMCEMKESREHLSEAERTIMAVQLQAKLKGTYVKVRAQKMVAARSASLTGKQLPAESTVGPKRDSRKEVCERLTVPLRMFNATKRLSTRRPDLYKLTLAGELDLAMAMKQMGRNGENERVSKARAMAIQVPAQHSGQLINNIHCGDAVEKMRDVPDESVSLVLYSPPYHGVPIEYDPPLPPQSYAQYLDYQRLLLAECFRASRAGGRVAIVLDTVRNRDASIKHHMLPVVSDMTQLALECGWQFLNELSWRKDEISGSKDTFGSLGLCSAPSFARNHETILLLCKETHKLSGDPDKCDLTRKEHLQWWATAWDIKPEVDKTRRLLHPAPFPEEIPHRLIRMLTFREDLVVDPYNGSGTTTAVAKRLGRRYIGIDQSEPYCALARQRTAETIPSPSPALANAIEGSIDTNSTSAPMDGTASGPDGHVARTEAA